MPVPRPHIRPFHPADLAEWRRMRLALWPELAAEVSQQDDATRWLARTDAIVLVADLPNQTGLSGFAEVGQRDYADGCDSQPVAYLEAWYVDPHLRGQACENVRVVSSNPPGASPHTACNVAVGSDGIFHDVLAYCTTAPPPPQPGEYLKTKQSITVTVSGGKTYPVRPNCLDEESNDVTITDVSANSSATCQ